MITAFRPAFLILSLGFALSGPVLHTALAEDAPAQNSGDAVQGHDQAIKTPAGKFVQDLGDHAIAIIADPAVTHDKRAEKFRQILRESFDLPTIGRFVIGRTWNAATDAQQKEYMRLFEELVVKTYGSRMELYTGEGFSVIGVRPESEKDTIVTSNITHPDGSEPTEIDWRVRLRDGKLGVIDVVVEGVSLSVTQRQEYASVIQRNGGQIDGLLDLMRQQLKDADAPPPQGQQHG
jgi:phospholipid transport system substrate-binding protein